MRYWRIPLLFLESRLLTLSLIACQLYEKLCKHYLKICTVVH